MAKIAVYDSTTGAIKRFVTCPASAVAAQEKSGEAQLDATGFTGDDTTHEIVAGEFATIE